MKGKDGSFEGNECTSEGEAASTEREVTTNFDDDALYDSYDDVVGDDALNSMTMSMLLKMLSTQGTTYCWSCTTSHWKSPRR